MNTLSVVLMALLLMFPQAVTKIDRASRQPSKRFQLRPVDEATKDPTFAAFRDRLKEAVKARDGQWVISSAVPELQGRFKLGLALYTQPGHEENTWAELDRLLPLGGVFTTENGSREGRREFCSPYTYAAYPGHVQRNAIVESLAGSDEHSEEEPWVVLGAKVPVRARPSTSGRVIGYLSHDLVLRTGEEAPGSPVVLWLDLCREVAAGIPDARFVITGGNSIAGNAHDSLVAIIDQFGRSGTVGSGITIAPEGGAGARPIIAPGGLTPREVQVLRLVATGLTNKEIAAKLAVAVPTIERHLVNVYTKIGARGRADATAYAVRHDLDTSP